MTFSEAWLKEYNQRRAAQSAKPPDLSPIRLKLSRPTVTLNELIRMHWRSRRMLASSISSEFARQLPSDNLSRAPFERALVTITRYSIQEADYDGAVGGAKILVDTLLPFSKRHPHGLGLVRDDSPQHMTQRFVSVVVAHRKEQRTEILIEPIST